jgi:2-keto-4-pentenoate hydratase/2-oxohepta-3-ene-1,7-dioic acid hydratase in catechol pathway
MIYPVGYLLSVLSEVMQLNPGDVVLTGTPEGVGFARTPPLWLSEGDRLRIRCDGLMPLELDVAKES